MTGLNHSDNFESIVARMVEMKRKKSRDYNHDIASSSGRTAFHAVAEREGRSPFEVALTLLNLKQVRLESLVKQWEVLNDSDDVTPGSVVSSNYESISDTLMDLASYAIWASMFFDNPIEWESKK